MLYGGGTGTLALHLSDLNNLLLSFVLTKHCVLVSTRQLISPFHVFSVT